MTGAEDCNEPLLFHELTGTQTGTENVVSGSDASSQPDLELTETATRATKSTATSANAQQTTAAHRTLSHVGAMTDRPRTEIDEDEGAIKDTAQAIKRARRGRRPKAVSPAPDNAERPRYLTVKQVATRFAIGVATVWRWVQEEDDFPDPIHLSKGTTRWAERDIEAFEAKKRAG